MTRCVIPADFEHRAFEQVVGCVAQRAVLELHIAGDARHLRVASQLQGGQLGMPQRTAFIGAAARQRCLFLGAALDPARRQPIRNRHGAGHRYVSYLEIVCPVCSSWKRSSDKPQALVIFPSLLNVKRKTRSTSKGSLETESV